MTVGELGFLKEPGKLVKKKKQWWFRRKQETTSKKSEKKKKKQKVGSFISAKTSKLERAKCYESSSPSTKPESKAEEARKRS